MEKAIKKTEPEEITPETVIEETPALDTPIETAFEGETEALPEEVLFEKPLSEISKPVHVWGQSDKESEIDFLKRILRIQHTGCFGRHLDSIINERIKSLE